MTLYLLKASNLAKRYPGAGQAGTDLTVFENVSSGIRPGEFVCTIGHSGCGKSTILNILAGLDRASGGLVRMDGKSVSHPELERGVVFQNHSLLPWLSALENVRFAVRARWARWKHGQITDHALHYLEMVGLKGVESRRPAQLSGGMRQRVGASRWRSPFNPSCCCSMSPSVHWIRSPVARFRMNSSKSAPRRSKRCS